ncbi:MAG: protein kinase [Gemmatimonadota bacterium]
MSTDLTGRIRVALAGRYRIERELGVGSSATVYLAEDLRHHRQVAVKVLRADLAMGLGDGRFLGEIRIASQLTHPHIMPVHDSGEADGFLFYVMPFSPGESLHARLKRDGELPIEDAVHLLEDVIDALGFAHRHGVVHRDVKPANVLTQGQHAMLVDFGVAKAVSQATSERSPEDTAAGMAIGTPEYMAPEQAAADPSVDHRADLYSAGVLAYELLTGRTPFRGGSPQSVLTRQITEAPTPVREHRPSVSPELEAWVMRSLEKRPADRWQSADEMLSALREIHIATGKVTIPSPAPPASMRVPRWLMGLAAASVVGVVAAWNLRPAPTIDESSRIVVDAFDNETGDPAFDQVGRMIQDWLTDGLLRSDLLEVVPTITARQAAEFIHAQAPGDRAPDLVSSLAEETGAQVVVSGSLYRDGDDLRIQTSVTDATDPDAARLLESIDPVVGSAEDITPLFDQVRSRLLGSLATSLTGRVQAQVGDSDGAPTYEAYEALDRGLDHYAARDYAEASGHFLRAFELDDSYAVPLVYASLSLRNHGEWARSDSVVSLLEARRDEVSEYQRFWIDYSRAVLEGDLDRARWTIRRAAMIAPQSKAAYNWALMAIRMGRPTEAREALSSLDPDRGAMRGDPRFWMRRVEASYHLGEHAEGLEEIAELEARYPDERSIFFYKVRAYAALGHVESLRTTFASVGSQVPPEVVAVRYRNAAVELFLHGHREAAEEFARVGIDFIDSRTTADRPSSFESGTATFGALEQLAYQRGRLLEVLGRRTEALEIYSDLYAANEEAWFLRAHMGVIHASLGQVSAAMEIDRWLAGLGVPYEVGDVTTWRAGIAARLGDQERATALLTQARQEGMPWTELNPIYHLHDALGEYEPFVALMEPQG